MHQETNAHMPAQFKIPASILLVAATLNAHAATDLCERLYRASEMGELNTVKEIVTVNPETASCSAKWGYTPLHAVVTGHGFINKNDLEIATFLISKGAKVEAKTDAGVTPLHITPYPEMVELLLKHGAHLETVDDSGGTAIMFYAESPDGYAVLKKALELGANPNHRDKAGLTAISIAKERHESRKIELLMQYGAK